MQSNIEKRVLFMLFSVMPTIVCCDSNVQNQCVIHESNFILTDEGRIHVKTQVDTLTLTLIFDSGGASPSP